MKIDLKLDKFFDRPKEEVTMGRIDIANNPCINTGLLDSIINNGTLNNYSDQQLFDLLSNNLRGFLLNIFERKDQRYIKMIISDRFLRVLIQVVGSIEIDYMNMIYLNKLCYDYLTLDDDYEDTIQGFIRDIKSKELSSGTLKNITTILNSVGAFEDYYIPIVDGQESVRIDTVPGMDVDIDDLYQEFSYKFPAGSFSTTHFSHKRW